MGFASNTLTAHILRCNYLWFLLGIHKFMRTILDRDLQTLRLNDLNAGLSAFGHQRLIINWAGSLVLVGHSLMPVLPGYLFYS